MYTVYHQFEADVLCVLVLIQPAHMFQKQNTRNVYLRTDDKRCTRILVGRVRQSRKGRTRENCNHEQKQYLRALTQGTTLPVEAHAQEWNSHKKSAQTRLMERTERGHIFCPLSLSSLHPSDPSTVALLLFVAPLPVFLPPSLATLQKLNSFANCVVAVGRRSHQSYS